MYHEEYRKREIRRIEYLMKMSGIKRIKLINDFDWKFNPKDPGDKIMEFMQTDWQNCSQEHYLLVSTPTPQVRMVG